MIFINNVNVTPKFRSASKGEPFVWSYRFDLSNLKPLVWCELIGISNKFLRNGFLGIHYKYDPNKGWLYRIGEEYFETHAPIIDVEIYRNRVLLEPDRIVFRLGKEFRTLHYLDQTVYLVNTECVDLPIFAFYKQIKLI